MSANSGSTYSKQEEIKYALKLNKMLDELPLFCSEYLPSSHALKSHTQETYRIFSFTLPNPEAL